MNITHSNYNMRTTHVNDTLTDDDIEEYEESWTSAYSWFSNHVSTVNDVYSDVTCPLNRAFKRLCHDILKKTETTSNMPFIRQRTSWILNQTHDWFALMKENKVTAEPHSDIELLSDKKVLLDKTDSNLLLHYQKLTISNLSNLDDLVAVAIRKNNAVERQQCESNNHDQVQLEIEDNVSLINQKKDV